MTLNLREIAKHLRLPSDTREKLERLADLPAVQKAFDELDDQTVSRRRELVAAIADAEKQQATAKATAARALRDAEQRLETAETELEAATDAYRHAQAVDWGSDASSRRQIAEAITELMETSDQRISEFRRLTLNLQEGLRLAVASRTTVGAPNILGKRHPVHHSNAAEVAAAMNTCGECLLDLASMRLSALSRFEITERLAELSARLQDAAARFGLPIPLVDQHGDVTSTRSGPGAPAVIVERQAKADELAAAAAERMARQG